MAAKTRLIALNGNAGPLVSVLATMCATRVTAREDEAASSQGLQYIRGDDVTANLNTVGTLGSPDQQQIDLWDNKPYGARGGRLQGIGPQAANFPAATIYFKAQSKSATATTLRVIEYD
ncbi:MAG TPA: hypothetical protein VKZ53_18560 [Candidatus Angelobacter sp.]|nr:hypothetical protein [Candidatus Angelobacter sp.]